MSSIPKMSLKSIGGSKIRVIEGWKKIKRMYVHRVKKEKAYMVTYGNRISLDDMVEIDGDFWFGTLKQLKQALENDN